MHQVDHFYNLRDGQKDILDKKFSSDWQPNTTHSVRIYIQSGSANNDVFAGLNYWWQLMDQHYQYCIIELKHSDREVAYITFKIITRKNA